MNEDSDDDSDFIEDPDVDDDDSKTMSKEDAMLREFIERKKKEFSIGSILSAKAVANMKKGQLKSKEALKKK